MNQNDLTTARTLNTQYRNPTHGIGFIFESKRYETHEQAMAKLDELKAYWTEIVDEQNAAKQLPKTSKCFRMQSGRTWLRIYRGSGLFYRVAVEQIAYSKSLRSNEKI